MREDTAARTALHFGNNTMEVVQHDKLTLIIYIGSL